MNNQTDQTDQLVEEEVFRVIGKPEVKEVTIKCDLRPHGENYTAILTRRSNFSDAFASAKTKFDKIAEAHTSVYGVLVSEITVRLADRLARMWERPLRPDGKKVNRDDLVKLSVENDKAFSALVSVIDGDEDAAVDEIGEAEEKAREDFTPGAEDTFGTS